MDRKALINGRYIVAAVLAVFAIQRAGGSKAGRSKRAGHAIVATALPGMDPVHKVSMIPRGAGALAYSTARPRTASCCRAATWKTDWPSFSATGPPRCWSSMRHPPGRPTI